jgi:hypothetical protein
MKYYAVIFDRITPFTPLSNNSPLPDFLGRPSYNTPPLSGMREALNYTGFHNDFIKPQEIRRWWHYMESLYIIGTDWSSQELSEHFIKTAQAHGIPMLHLVLEVNLRNRFGFLPKDAWEWIDKATADIPFLRSIGDP